ncbi:MAG: ARMT1-like domain-containing protein [bacterium]
MKSELECLLCLFKQGLNTARLATPHEEAHREILNRIAAGIESIDMTQSPAMVSRHVYSLVSDVTGVADPYREAKKQSNQEAIGILPDIERMIAESQDPLKTAIHVAVAGNVIDLGIGHEYNLAEDVRRLASTSFAIDHLEEFRQELRPGRKLLYLGDNAGEIVFDRVLVEQLLANNVEVTFCVKSGPIINDATMKDAQQAGITSLVPTITTGSADIGINLSNSSEEFLDALNQAEVILAKGHGNFETCIDFPHNFYFLLKAKCDVVSRALGVRTGDIVFRHKPPAGGEV